MLKLDSFCTSTETPPPPLPGPFRMSPRSVLLPSSSCWSCTRLWMWRGCGQEPHSFIQVSHLQPQTQRGWWPGGAGPGTTGASSVLGSWATALVAGVQKPGWGRKQQGPHCPRSHQVSLACSEAVHPIFTHVGCGVLVWQFVTPPVSSGYAKLWRSRNDSGHIIQFLVLNNGTMLAFLI